MKYSISQESGHLRAFSVIYSQLSANNRAWQAVCQYLRLGVSEQKATSNTEVCLEPTNQ